jgi:hypothetical protein
MRMSIKTVAVAAVTAVLAGTLSIAPANADGAPACTIAAAGTVPMGTSFSVSVVACPNGVAYGLVNAQAGSTITVDIAATGSGPFIEFYWPGTTDFNRSNQRIMCGHGSSGQFIELACQVPTSGQVVVGLDLGAAFGGDGTGSATIRLSTAPVIAAQVPGSCLLTGAPAAPNRVRQYGGGVDCSIGHMNHQWWAMHLFAGDTLSVLAGALAGWNGDGSVLVYQRGVTDYTVDSAYTLCYEDFITSLITRDCGVIPATGTYYAALDQGQWFSPAITHRVVNTVTKPARVAVKHAVTVTDRLTSPAGAPAATCSLQYLTSVGWRTLKAVPAVKGVCRISAVFRTRGARKVRVLETGRTGWATHASPLWRLTVY